jgi:hypothetical protein
MRFLTFAVVLGLAADASAQSVKGWTKGKGFGWVYGSSDEIGSLNAVNSPELILRALRDVKAGRVYDLGVRVDRSSYKWPGHSPTEIMSFRSPGGLAIGKDIAGFQEGQRNLGFHSCAMFISDNVGTQTTGTTGFVRPSTDRTSASARLTPIPSRRSSRAPF